MRNGEISPNRVCHFDRSTRSVRNGEILPNRVCHFDRSGEISPNRVCHFDRSERKRTERRNLPGYISDTLSTTPRSVRRVYPSTLRRACSKSLKRRTREEGAGKGEFAFTECRNFHHSLAQNCSICAKEEPQAQKAYKAGLSAL